MHETYWISPFQFLVGCGRIVAVEPHALQVLQVSFICLSGGKKGRHRFDTASWHFCAHESPVIDLSLEPHGAVGDEEV